jgi:hypothetical protein
VNWAEFIKEIARQKLHKEAHRLTFLEIFGDNESPTIDKTIMLN